MYAIRSYYGVGDVRLVRQVVDLEQQLQTTQPVAAKAVAELRVGDLVRIDEAEAAIVGEVGYSYNFV